MIDYPAILREVARRQPKHATRLEAHAVMLERTPETRRDNVAYALSIVHKEYPWRGKLATVYPCASETYQARLVLGESPAAITGLSAGEAHAYLSQSTRLTPAEWLFREASGRGDWTQSLFPRDVPTARWLAQCIADPARRSALERQRCERGPGGVEVRGRYVDRVDELTAKDLCDSVEQTFRRAGARLWKATERLLARDKTALCQPPQWWRSLRCARLLCRAAELVVEGREMGHCVAQYAPAIKSGNCVIVSINVCGYRSTAEFSRKGKLQQHKGPHNSSPHALCARALAVLVRRCGLQMELA